MGTTTHYAIPFPAGTDPPAGAPQMQALADKVDSSLWTVAGTIQPGVQSFTQAQIDALTPAQKTPGMIVWNSTKYWHQAWNTASWEYVNDVPRMTTAERDILQPRQLGTLIWNTSTNTVQVYNGTTWTGLGGNDALWNAAWGKVVEVTTTTAKTGIGSTPVDILTATFTPVNGRAYRVTAQTGFVQQASAALVDTFLTDASNALLAKVTVPAAADQFVAFSGLQSPSFSPAAGIAYTAKFRASTTAGTLATNVGVGVPAILYVEDIGPAAPGTGVPLAAVVPASSWQTAWGRVASFASTAGNVTIPTGTGSANQVNWIQAGNVSMVAGRRYQIIPTWTVFQGTATESTVLGAKVDGASIGGYWYQPWQSYGMFRVDALYYDCSVTGTHTVSAYAERVSGTNNMIIGGKQIDVTDVGPVNPLTPDLWPPNPTPGPWLTLPYGSGWSGAASFPPGAYRKVGDEVQLRGIVTGPASGNTIATLPAGYRPPSLAAPNGPIFNCWVYGQTQPACRIDVTPAGVVLLQGGLTGTITYLSLDQISFSTVA